MGQNHQRLIQPAAIRPRACRIPLVPPLGQTGRGNIRHTWVPSSGPVTPIEPVSPIKRGLAPLHLFQDTLGVSRLRRGGNAP